MKGNGRSVKFYKDLTEEEKTHVIYLPGSKPSPSAPQKGKGAVLHFQRTLQQTLHKAQQNTQREKQPDKQTVSSLSPFEKPMEWRAPPESEEDAAPFFETAPGFQKHYAELSDREKKDIVYLPDCKPPAPEPAVGKRGSGEVIMFPLQRSKIPRFIEKASFAVALAVMAFFASAIMTQGLDRASDAMAKARAFPKEADLMPSISWSPIMAKAPPPPKEIRAKEIRDMPT